MPVVEPAFAARVGVFFDFDGANESRSRIAAMHTERADVLKTLPMQLLHNVDMT